MSVIRFGEFELDEQTFELRRKGVPARIQQQPARVLAMLISNQGAMVTREQIRAAIWGNDTFVDFEQGLNYCIRQIRLTLSDQAESPRYVETLPRLGYRFIAPIEKIGTIEVASNGQMAAVPRGIRIAMAPIELLDGTEADSFAPQRARISKSPASSIAVLPFASVSGDSEQFGDGLSEELIHSLSLYDDLQVIARASAAAVRGQGLDIREIGRRLNVGVILDGSVRRAGNRLRITAQLIDVNDGHHLWSERYDREMTDVIEVQDEITAAIVDKLRPQLLGARFPSATRHSEDPEAYALYLKGRHHWGRRPAGTMEAIAYFEQAVKRDPTYALAYAGLADAYNTLASSEGGVLPPGEGFPKGMSYAEQALRLKPELAEGHAALAYAMLHYRREIPEAERLFSEAIRLNPRYGPAHHWYSHLLVATERMEESLAESKIYLSLDPADPMSQLHLMWHHLMAHNFDQALSESGRALATDPGFSWHRIFQGWAHLGTGATGEAEAAIRKGAELSGASVQLSFLGHAQAMNGNRADALRTLERLTTQSANRYVSPYELGLIYEALGDRDQAFAFLDQAFAERSPWLVYLAREPRLRHLHGDPRFDALLARLTRDSGAAPAGATR
jgi:TolB-like protein/DNA-binding winged helix-turn-helix (wHTH) protein/Tfp pilus assembly protein PilF